MTTLIQDSFNGIAPKIDKRKLAGDLAVIAENCAFDHGNLRALRWPEGIDYTLTAATKTVSAFNDSWIAFDDRRSFVEKGPVINDTYKRWYAAGGDLTYPQVGYLGFSYRLGLPRPPTPTIGAVPNPPDENPETLLEVETIHYVVTYVDVFGHEGPPSDPTVGVDRYRDDSVVLTLPTVATGNYALGSGAKFRIYRSNTGTQASYFQYVAQMPITSPSFNDTVPNSELQELLPTATWLGPPDDNTALWPDGPLEQIAMGPNGIMAGYAGRTIYFCEPFLPHAWPAEYTIPLSADIQAIVWISSGLLVVTNEMPALISGTHPASMALFIPEQGWPCDSKYSVVDMGGWAIYSSPEGLVGVEGQTFQLLTKELVDRRAWSQLAPAGGVAGNSEGRYVYFFDDDAGYQGSIIFDIGAGKGALTTSTIWSDVAYSDPIERRLMIKDEINELAEFDAGLEMTYTWRSKYVVLGEPTNFAYLEVVANEYPVSVTLKAGADWGAIDTVFDIAVAGRFTSLPSGFEYDHWQFEVSDDKELVFVGLYEDLTEAG